ncbi:MAG: hypothetical protein QOJ94_2362 [Sphingomonadales bacterium]|jgi:hypothetical protein|nr:hypothetical protein [Sphingomonadales bacterium]
MEEQARADRTRRLSLPLLAGMLVIPAVFVWFFLRRGYSGSLRRAAFFYTAVMSAIVFVGRLAG